MAKLNERKDAMTKTNKSTLKNTPDIFRDYRIEFRPVSEIGHDPKHPRKITEKQKEKAAACIHATGFVMPAVVDKNGMAVIGAEWVEAARILGLDEIPVIPAESLTETQVRSLRIAYPKIQDIGEWDLKILAAEFQFLVEMKVDLRGTAFDTPEIDIIMGANVLSQDESIENTIPEIDPDKPAVSVVGDLWFLDRHRLICANATIIQNYEILMDGEKAQAVIADPPFNVPNKGHTGGKGSIKHREFVEAHGEKSEEEFIAFLAEYLAHSRDSLADGGLIYSFMDWRSQYEMLMAVRKADLKQINLVVWNKNNGAMGSLYRSKHELVHVLKKNTASHINNVELGKHGRYRTNVWDYAGINTFRKGRMAELALHPTVKPAGMIADAILDCTHRDQIVLDPFAGSGTIFISCEKTGRRGYAIELDPLYADTSVRRWQEFTGKQAVHAQTGLTFAEHEQNLHKELCHG